MEREEVHEPHQQEDASFIADVLSDLEIQYLPRTTTGRLRERIDRNNLVVKIAAGDGNCLFRSLLKALKRKQKHHMMMRRILVKEMTDNKMIYTKFAAKVYELADVEPFYDQYLEEMSKERTWGDIVCILAAANVFHVRIIVISADEHGWAQEFYPTDDKSKKDVYLSTEYHNREWSHANAVFPREEVPAVDSRSPSPSDRREFVRWYMVYVENVPESMTADDLSKKASVHGEVFNATIVSGERIGFFKMTDKTSMEAAIAGMNGQIWDEMTVKVKEAKAKGGSPYDYNYDFSQFSIS